MDIAYPNPLWSRVLSFALAALIFLNSNAIAAIAGAPRTALLAFSLWGIAAGFVHGVGFLPRRDLWRLLFHPAAGWPLLTACAAILLTVFVI